MRKLARALLHFVAGWLLFVLAAGPISVVLSEIYEVPTWASAILACSGVFALQIIEWATAP